MQIFIIINEAPITAFSLDFHNKKVLPCIKSGIIMIKFLDIIMHSLNTPLVNVIDCDLVKSFTTVEITGHVRFPIHV